jgi:hypothetical protein
MLRRLTLRKVVIDDGAVSLVPEIYAENRRRYSSGNRRFLQSGTDMLENSARENCKHLLSHVSNPELVSRVGLAAEQRFEVSSESSFGRLRRGVVLTNTVQPSVLVLIAAILLGVVLGTSQDVIFVAGVPLPALVFVAVGLVSWIFIASKMVWHLRMSDLARQPGIVVFVIGLFFTGAGYLVDGPAALVVTNRRGKELARLAKSDISGVIAVDQTSNVGVVIKVGDRFLEMPLVMQLHGPVARRWSMAGYAPQSSLLHAIRDCFANQDIRVVELDRHYKPLSKQ